MIIASISFKGGVGKSTIAQNLGVYYTHQGHKTCIVDADPMHSTISWQSFREDDLPSVPVYGNTEPKSITKSVSALYEDYNIVIVDCPPAINPMTTRIILLSHGVLIPLPPTGGGDIWGTEQLLQHISNLNDQREEPINAYFVINKFQPNLNLHKAYLEALKQYEEEYNVKILESNIGYRVAFGAANSQGMGVQEWEDKKAKQEIAALAKEVVEVFQ